MRIQAARKFVKMVVSSSSRLKGAESCFSDHTRRQRAVGRFDGQVKNAGPIEQNLIHELQPGNLSGRCGNSRGMHECSPTPPCSVPVEQRLSQRDYS